jgi:hypothetical protein
MNSCRSATLFSAIAWLLVLGAGCSTKDRAVEVVLTGKTCAEFQERHAAGHYTTPVVIEYAPFVDDVLEEEGLDRFDIIEARVMSASYRVTEFTHSHDWTISGYISVVGLGADPGGKLLEYTDQSILAAKAAPVAAHLDSAGVAIVNEALRDYLDGGWPVLVFYVNGGGVQPAASEADSLIFTWEACITIHVLYEQHVDVPEPF